MTDQRLCSVCGSECGVTYKINHERVCKDCFGAKELHVIEAGLGFNTSKDKLWEFTDYHITGKPIEIHSKSQWKRLLIQHHLHDDVNKDNLRHIIDINPRRKSEEQGRELRKTYKEVFESRRRK